MMLSRVESGKDSGSSDLSSSSLLRDIEEISRALYPQKTPPNNVISPSDRRSKSAGKTRSSKSNSNFANEEWLHKDKKSSIWNWKPLKALTHIRNRRFNCWFFLHVHAIEGLPSSFNDSSLHVEWKKKDEVRQTRSSRVCQGTAEFEESLMQQCSVYGSRNGHHHSAKFEPKLFLLYASVTGAPGLDLGKHWIDLTRLLPLTLEELEEETISGKWTTSFELAGKAKGAILKVSFGYSVMGDKSSESGRSTTISKRLKEMLNTKDCAVDIGQDNSSGMLRMVGSVPRNSNRGSRMPSRSLDIKIVNEVYPSRGSELARSITSLCQKLDEAKFGRSQEFDFISEHVEPLKPKPGYFSESSLDNVETELLNADFTVIEQGIELFMKEQLKSEGGAQTSGSCAIETIDLSEIFSDDEAPVDGEMGCDSIDDVHCDFKDHLAMEDNTYETNGFCTKALMFEELDSVKYNLALSESGDFDPSFDLDEIFDQEQSTKNRSSYKEGKMVKSRSLDDVTECVANDFLNMLAIEHIPLDFRSDSEPESPRGLLLRQFEEETLASGDFILDFDGEEEHEKFSVASGPTAEWGDLSDHFDVPLVIRAAEKDEDQKRMTSKRNAKLLEDLETEALMREWGLNEKVFQNSPRTSPGGFGSPIYLPPEEPLEPLEFPPLGEGLGPILQTKDGGFLRSMNPSLFRNAKNGGCLIMQVSTPVVLPVAMGSSIMEILQHWTSVGFEKMDLQVNKLMPLEDVNGKIMQQVAWEVASRLEAPESLPYSHHESEHGQDLIDTKKKIQEFALDRGYKDLVSSSMFDEIDSDFVSLEDLAPLAMDKIEALSIEGLRIQSGMSDEEAPSCIRPESMGKTSTFLGTSVKVGGPFILEGAVGLQLSEVKDNGGDVDELLSLSITLDEWMRLDAGIFGDEEEISERTLKILAAHLGENMEFTSEMLIRGSKWDKPNGRSCGLLGNNFTVALRVQLRDPLRDFEVVGSPMLALVQVERVFVDLKQKVYCRFSERNVNEEEDDRFEVAEGINAEEKEEKKIEGGIPWFKITEVHVAGFNIEPGKKQQWGTPTQEQSGARWLLASGMAKNIKGLYLKSNAIVKSSSQGVRKLQPRDAVWSISSHVHGPRAKWKELATLNLHIRNPDVTFLA